jgi:hypothetical protein
MRSVLQLIDMKYCRIKGRERKEELRVNKGEQRNGKRRGVKEMECHEI